MPDADNAGGNDVAVFNGPLSISSAGTPAGTDFGAFDIVINLTTPFLYDPAAGNLLLDIRNFSSGTVGDLGLDMDSSANSPVALVFVDNSTAATSGTVQPFGIIAQFTFSTVPEPATWAYLVAGAALFAFVSWRRSTNVR